MGHITLMVPEGHAVQVHPPGTMPHMAPQSGMIGDPALAGAKAAMDTALPVPNEHKTAPKAKPQPERKKKPGDKEAKSKGEGVS